MRSPRRRLHWRHVRTRCLVFRAGARNAPPGVGAKDAERDGPCPRSCRTPRSRAEPPGARPQAVAPAPAPEAVPGRRSGTPRRARSPGRGAQLAARATLLRLQVVLGNRAVQRLVQSPQASAPGGGGAAGGAGTGRRRRERRGRLQAPVQRGRRARGQRWGRRTGGAPAGASPRPRADRLRPGDQPAGAPALAGAHRPPGRRDRRCQVSTA